MKFWILALLCLPCYATAEEYFPTAQANVLPKTVLEKLKTKSESVERLDLKSPQIPLQQVVEAALVGQIPVIEDPRFMTVEDAVGTGELAEEDYAVVVENLGETKAYPLRFLNWHYGVTDVVGEEELFIAWDPLTAYGTAWALDAGFGVSGFVYRSQTLYYDVATRGLVHPMLGKIVSGDISGVQLQKKDVYLAQLKDIAQYDKDIRVMTTTEFMRPYGTQHPYEDYMRSKALLFPVDYNGKHGLARKEMVLGVKVKDGFSEEVLAIPLNTLLKRFDALPKALVKIRLNRLIDGQDIPLDITIKRGNIRGEFNIFAEGASQVEQFLSYYFAWSSLYPNSMVMKTLPH